MAFNVYIFKCEKFLKVGFSIDVEQRLASIQATNPHKVEKVHVRSFDDRSFALTAERAIHDRLKLEGKHVHGEWFIDAKDTRDSIFLYLDSEIEVDLSNNRKIMDSLDCLASLIKRTSYISMESAVNLLKDNGFILAARVLAHRYARPVMPIVEGGAEDFLLDHLAGLEVDYLRGTM